MTAYRLHIDSGGKLHGRALITHNDPWPCRNGQGGLTPPMAGAVMHTMVGDLPGTIDVFNQDGFSASAHFAIGGPWSKTEGRIHQFGPVNGWEAWAQEDGNNMWFSVEHEDGGDPSRPLTDAQLTASAQVLEALATQSGGWGFPLQVTDHTTGHGYAAHYIGGIAWGGHSCPDPAPGGQGPRSHQRHEIVRRARILRSHGQYPAPASYATISADGQTTLAEIAAQYKTGPSTILRMTAEHGPSQPVFDGPVTAFIDGVFAASTEVVPAGTVLIAPANLPIRIPAPAIRIAAH